MKQATDFDITVTNSELEALVLETNLIKESKPKYNVLMKDDKNYVYLKITTQDACPAVDVVRRLEEDGATYFGPYLSGYELKKTLEMLHGVVGYRACVDSVKQYNKENGSGTGTGTGTSQASPTRTRTRARKIDETTTSASDGCLEYQIGQCNGLCCGKISVDEYKDRIATLVQFYKGDTSGVMKRAQEQMTEAAANKQFERAAQLRDALKYMEKIAATQIVSDTSGEDSDFIGLVLEGDRIQVVVLRERGGKVIDELSRSVKGETEDASSAMGEFIPQFYLSVPDIPDRIVIGEELEGSDILEQWLRDRKGKKVEIRVPERGKKNKLLELAAANAREKIKQQEAKWEAAARNIDDALEGLKDALKLADIPKRIEGYDISHLGGTETVGSMVVTVNGKPANKEYRSFTIKTLKEGEIDDYRALAEVLRRRLRHLQGDAKQRIAQWHERGIEIGKARKADQIHIEEIVKSNVGVLSDDHIEYSQYVVAKREGDIVGLARLFENSGKIYEIKSVWVHEDLRGQKLGHTLIALLLSRHKEKVYVTFDPQYQLEEYYSAIGFRHVREPPKLLQEKSLAFCKQHPESQPGIFMVYNPADNKPDSSLRSKPDLLVIDGGKGQLSAVVDVLIELELQIPVIGLAKREEEVFVPGSSVSILLPKDSQSSFLLQRLRNEAHRFSNDHSKKRLAHKTIASALDEVPGIGEKTKRELLMQFGSVKGVREASDEELLTVVNIAQLESIRRLL